jgi:hypothetical protein
MKNTDSSIYYYEKGRNLAIEQNSSQMAFIAEYNIANTYSNAGQYERSNTIIQNLLITSKQIPPGMTEGSNYLIAKNYLKLNRLDKSIQVARKSLDKAIASKSKQLIILVSEILGQAYQIKKKNDSALYFLKIHHSYKDSVYNQESQKKLSTLYAEIETIAKQKEIQLLERESELDHAENRILQLTIAFGSVLTPLAIVTLILTHWNKQKKQKLINYELQSELDQKKKDLHQQALRMIYLNNGLTEVEEGLKKIRTTQSDAPHEIQHVLNSIHLNKSLEKEWNNFDAYFGSVHVGFYERFNGSFPQLTILEKRLAGLIRMNLTNSEIASVLNIENNSVKMSKYRLKKKLALTDEQDINQFLQTFG